MSNGEGRRWIIPNRVDDFGFHVAIEKDVFIDQKGYSGYTEVLPVDEHEEVVAELRTEVDRLRELVEELIQRLENA